MLNISDIHVLISHLCIEILYFHLQSICWVYSMIFVSTYECTPVGGYHGLVIVMPLRCIFIHDVSRNKTLRAGAAFNMSRCRFSDDIILRGAQCINIEGPQWPPK